MRRLACMAVLACPLAAVCDESVERTVRDLAYGEVLFEFYQDDHLAALTRLLAGIERNELPNHAHDADLLLGALYLSYGQHQVAGQVFAQVLEQAVEPEVHDRAWYFLAKIWHQRGYLAEAEQALARIGNSLPPSFAPERVMLEAQVLMASRRFDEALAVLEAWQDPEDEWVGYARYNIGVAQVRLGNVAGGAEVLEQVGEFQSGRRTSDTMLALRDRANVALGYAWLQAEQPAAAKPALQRVRLDGPFSNKALLGVGWADAELQDYQSALAPWFELRTRDLLDSAVQESLLAVPYALTRLAADGQAAEHYLAAIDAFAAEADRIDAAIETIRSGQLLADWLAMQQSNATGWYFELAEIPQNDESRYLVELMASNEFQEGVKTYRDLLDLSANFGRWLENLAVFDDILDTRQRAFLARQPRLESSLSGIDIDAMEQQRVAIESRLFTIEQTEDVVALGTQEQQRIWRELDAMEPKLDLIRGQPGAAELIEKQRFFKGLLLWELRRDYNARLWNQQRSLREIDRELRAARRHHYNVMEQVEGWPVEFADLTEQVGSLRPRVESLKATTDALILRQRRVLEQTAVAALRAQRERIDTYMVQARFSLAAIYDRAAAADPAGPAADPADPADSAGVFAGGRQ